MKKIFLLLCVSCVFITNGFAQLTNEQRIQDSIIGWWNNNKFDNALKPTTDPIQKKRIAIDDSLVAWMKKSYTPVAGLGTFTRQNQPNYFGVYFMVWNVSFDKDYLDAQNHFKPIPEENTPFRINANLIPGSYSIPFLSNATQTYFTWPQDGYRVSIEDQNAKRNVDPKIHPNVYNYITRFSEKVNIFLAPNNKLPFKEVSIGEYLDSSEASLDKAFLAEKEKIDRQWTKLQSRDEAYAYQQKEFDRYRNAIKKWRQKYSTKLNEQAFTRHMQPTIINEFFGDIDPFEGNEMEKRLKQLHPIYKLDASTTQKCKTEKPQWIAISFPYFTKENGNQQFELYTTLTQNVNYEYIYNYFFDAQKVQGKPYTAANAGQQKSRMNAYKLKNAAAINPFSPNSTPTGNTHFEDNFSSGIDSRNPFNWFFNKYGKHSNIRSLKNGTENWLELGYNNAVSPTTLKKPLPQNCIIEYDIVTDGGYTSRTGGAVELILNTRNALSDGGETLAGNGSQISVRTIAGNEADYNNNNYMGLATLKINSIPEPNKQNYSDGLHYEYALKEFTNNKTKMHIAVSIKNGLVEVLANNNLIASSANSKLTYGGACIQCGIPSNTTIKSIYWKNITNDADNIKVYISNIKITKL
jgi:hypothetical protein